MNYLKVERGRAKTNCMEFFECLLRDQNIYLLSSLALEMHVDGSVDNCDL